MRTDMENLELNTGTPARRFSLKQIYKSPSFGIFLILILMGIVLALTTSSFLTESNLLSVCRAFSFTAIMSIGECMVIITGGIDLSVGSVFAFSGVMSAIAMTAWGLGPIPGIIVGLLFGASFGFINGVLITKLSMPPFIATLGIMSVARGLSYGITGGYPISKLPVGFKFLGQGYIAGIPFPIILMVILAVIFTIFLTKTIIGRRIYAIGGNEQGAKVSGIRTERVKLIAYSLSGVMAGLAGIMTAARLGTAQSTAGDGYEMDAISAVILGGASISGGSGTVLGGIIGAAIMGVLRNGLVLLEVDAYWQQAVIGCVIIIAVAFDQMRYKMAAYSGAGRKSE
jgi:ribose transport system permease protein